MSEPTSQKSEIESRLAAGHFKKAEAAFAKLVSGMSPEDVKAKEPELRILSSKFLPSHKARHRRLEARLAARINAKPVTLEAAPTVIEARKLSTSKLGPSQLVEPPISLAEIEEQEFDALVEEMRPFGFTQSIQASNYIKQNNLQTRYSHITGLGTFADDDRPEWELEGAISGRMFARVCRALGLSHKGTSARLVRFVSFRDVD